jgi:hypothetical protein
MPTHRHRSTGRERIEAALDCLLRAALEHRGARSPAIIGT